MKNGQNYRDSLNLIVDWGSLVFLDELKKKQNETPSLDGQGDVWIKNNFIFK